MKSKINKASIILITGYAIVLILFAYFTATSYQDIDLAGIFINILMLAIAGTIFVYAIFRMKKVKEIEGNLEKAINKIEDSIKSVMSSYGSADIKKISNRKTTADFCDPLGIRIFFFISLIINLFKEISDNPPPNSQRAICFILQQSFKLIVCKGKKNIRI